MLSDSRTVRFLAAAALLSAAACTGGAQHTSPAPELAAAKVDGRRLILPAPQVIESGTDTGLYGERDMMFREVGVSFVKLNADVSVLGTQIGRPRWLVDGRPWPHAGYLFSQCPSRRGSRQSSEQDQNGVPS